MAMVPISKKNLVVLALALADGKPLSPVQMQKAIFLLQNRLPQWVVAGQMYHFEPYNYGPFCAELNKDVALLAEQGLASPKANTRGDLEYSANASSCRRADMILDQLPTDIEAKARSIVRWVRVQPFNNLVKTIYKLYPHYKVRTIFRETAPEVEELAYRRVPAKRSYVANAELQFRGKRQPLPYPLPDV